MAQAHTQDTGHDTPPAGIGWRTFQLLGLLTALSWLVSYLVFLDGYTALLQVFELSSVLWIVGGIGYFLSPLISVVLIGIAVWPRALAVLNRGDATALGARAAIVLIPLLWVGTVFIGSSAMVNQLFAAPLGHSVALPVIGGAFVHVVFQHWFQGLVAIMLGLVPGQFTTLTEAEQPAGIQCAVVQCS